MATPELLEYIRAARAQGLRDDVISQNLARAGWNPADVQEALGGQDMPAASAPVSPPAPIPLQQAAQPSVVSEGVPAPVETATSQGQPPAPATLPTKGPSFVPPTQAQLPHISGQLARTIPQTRAMPFGVHMVDEKVSKKPVSGERAVKLASANPHQPKVYESESSGSPILMVVGGIAVFLFIGFAAAVFFFPSFFEGPILKLSGLPDFQTQAPTGNAASASPTSHAVSTTHTMAPMIPATTSPQTQASSTTSSTTQATSTTAGKIATTTSKGG